MAVRCVPLLIFLLHSLSAQTCLSLSTAAAATDGTATLDLALNSSAEPPASLQWTLRFPSGIRSLTVDDGPAATAANKAVMCTGNAIAYTCLVVGGNANTIASGVIAKVTAVLASNVTSAIISIGNPMGVSADGYFIPISSAGGAITSARVSVDRKLRPPLTRIAGRCSTQ